jgi:hypothetical protein
VSGPLVHSGDHEGAALHCCPVHQKMVPADRPASVAIAALANPS